MPKKNEDGRQVMGSILHIWGEPKMYSPFLDHIDGRKSVSAQLSYPTHSVALWNKNNILIYFLEEEEALYDRYC